MQKNSLCDKDTSKKSNIDDRNTSFQLSRNDELMDSSNESSIFSNSKNNSPEALNLRDLADESATIKSSYNPSDKSKNLNETDFE
jgi:hypothetical protein